jgi:hypothetical protein
LKNTVDIAAPVTIPKKYTINVQKLKEIM